MSAMIFEHKKMKTITGYTFSICHEVIVLDDTTLMAEIEELKILLKKVKEESGKVGLKLNIQKTKIMASGPITSWEIDGETVETVSDFIFLGSKITADGDCSHEIKRRLLLRFGRPVFCPWVWKIPWRRKWQPTPVLLPRKSHGRRTLVQATVHGVAKSWTRLSDFTLLHLLLGREVMINLDSIFKSRDITLPAKVRLVKAMVFPVVMYGCESWTIKKAEHRRIDDFELWCRRRLLRVPWTARRSNQSIQKKSVLSVHWKD